MSVKNIITEIEQDVADVLATQFAYTTTTIVPNGKDTGLSYERGKQKTGKILETCVLYVDIRNSVALNDAHRSITMGKIYTSFTKAVIKAGRYHGGHTRNIIGDRVMIVFPEERCFTNAIECAISINHIVKNILNKKFTTVDFKCGIGIDYGELKILKVGIQRNGTEAAENKGLVWAGYPANIASRLTDKGNKTDIETYYEVVRNPINPRALRNSVFALPIYTGYGVFGGQNTGYDPNAPLHLTSTEKIEMTESEFAQSFSMYSSGGYYTTGGKMIFFERKTRSTTYPPILITEAVHKGLISENLRKDLFGPFKWLEQKHKIRDVDCKVYGSGMIWKL